MTNISGAV